MQPKAAADIREGYQRFFEERGHTRVPPAQLLARDDPTLAFQLAHLASRPTTPTPIGVFRDVERPVYDELMSGQLEAAQARQGRGDLAKLLHGGDTWQLG